MLDRFSRRAALFLIGGTLAAGPLPPEDLVRLMRGARIALESGRTSDAVAQAKQAAEEYPDEIAPVMTLWEYHRRLGLPEEDAERFRSLLLTRLRDPSSSLPPGTVRYLVSRPSATKEELEQLEDALRARVDGRPDDMELLRELAFVRIRLDRPAEARESLGRVLAKAPDPTTLRECAALDIRLERWESAESLLADLPLDDWGFFVGLWRARVLAELGRTEELTSVLNAIESKIQPAPSSRPDVVRRIGPLDVAWAQVLEAAWSRRDAGRDEEAERLFRRVLVARPDWVEAQRAVQQLYATEEEARARDAAEASRRAGIEDGDSLLQEGSKLLAAGDVAGALPMLERATLALPDSEIARFNLGLAAVRLERWDVAERALSRAVQLNPRRAEGALYLGVALRGLERCADAIRELDRALALAPDLSAAHYYLFDCHSKLGHTSEALRHRTLYEQSQAK